MDLLELITKYWSLIAFVGVTIGSWVKFTGSVADMKVDMQKQKEEYDKQILKLEVSQENLQTRFDEHKDKMSESMNLIQQDIREIMTILKGNIINK
mgnify:CR=1